MRASYRSNASDPTTVDDLIGFRIALVPEPATLGLLTLGAVFLIRRPRASRFQSEAALV